MYLFRYVAGLRGHSYSLADNEMYTESSRGRSSGLAAFPGSGAAG